MILAFSFHATEGGQAFLGIVNINFYNFWSLYIAHHMYTIDIIAHRVQG
jgi:hypothetical protein